VAIEAMPARARPATEALETYPELVPANGHAPTDLAPTNGHPLDLTVLPDLIPVMVPAPTVAILGLGYVGLPTALALLETGSRVIGIDVSRQRLSAIRSRRVDLSPLDHARLGKALRGRRLTLSRRPPDLAAADVVIVAVPTPVDEHLVPDLSILEAACASVVAAARPGQTLILTSTSYVGCTRDLLIRPLERRGMTIGEDIFVAFSPERIDPGNLTFPQERVPRVVGGVTPECLRRAVQVVGAVAPFTHEVSSPEVAEMTKLHENIFRAVNIALANEMADVARGLGIDVTEVISAASTKPYGFMAFSPGPGVGGHCIPCDPHYLLWQLRRDRVDAPLIEQAMTSIAARPRQVVARALQLLGERQQPVRGARIIVVGVAYKPGVEDVRESPALEIMNRLMDAGAEVAFTDRLVDCLHIDGHEVCAERNPADLRWDLAIVHTFDSGMDLNWLDAVPSVLDASYHVRSVGVTTL
jgi:nucleotide sugar dehydrogenase